MAETKKAIISGGSRGIGRGIAYTLASKGFDVAISYAKKLNAAEETARIIAEKNGRKCYYFEAHLERRNGYRAFYNTAVEALGDPILPGMPEGFAEQNGVASGWLETAKHISL